jgi:putative transposase
MLELKFDSQYTTRWRRVKEFFDHEIQDPWSLIKNEARILIKSRLEAFCKLEFDQQIKRGYREVTHEPLDYRNGTRKRTLKTSLGTIRDIRVPRGRKAGYKFSLLRRYKRMHQEVDTAILWATLCGMSNARTTEFFKGFVGDEFSEATVANILKGLDEELRAFRTFPIAIKYPYLILDGLNIHILEGGVLEEKVVIFAMGIDKFGKADMLAFMLVTSEDEESYKTLLNDLYKRGLTSVNLIIHDGAGGITAGCNWVYPYAQHQRCVFHKQMNLVQNIRHYRNKGPMIKESKKIFKADTKKEALKLAAQFRQRWQHKEPKAIRCFFKDFAYCLTYFSFPKEHWPMIRTTNYLELYFKQIRSRIKKIGCFRNRFSAERYIFGLTKLIYHKLEDVTLNEPLHTIA